MAWHRVAARSEIPPGEAIQVRVGDDVIAVFDVGGRLYATDDTCTHAFACLSDGYLEGEYVECPLHQGRFHIPTGAAQGFPVTEDLRVYPVREDGDDVMVEVGD